MIGSCCLTVTAGKGDGSVGAGAGPTFFWPTKSLNSCLMTKVAEQHGHTISAKPVGCGMIRRPSKHDC